MDKLLLFTLAVYGLCFILMHGTIFNNIRNYCIERSSWFKDLITCPICLGFWCGLALAPFIFDKILFIPAAFYSSAACYIIHITTGFIEDKS